MPLNYLELKGSHGTTASSAMKILKSGFRLNKTDKASLWGMGAYFWTNRGDCHSLSKDWCEYRWKQAPCYVLCSKIEVEKERFLDFGDTDIQRQYLKFKKNAEEKLACKALSREDLQKIKVVFLNKCDQYNGKKYQVVKAPVPQGFRLSWQNGELGNPAAYIVRDINCINDVKDNRDGRHCSCCLG